MKACSAFLTFWFFYWIQITIAQEYPVVWTGGIGVSVDLESITLIKTASAGWGNGGARSINTLSSTVDGYVKFTLDGDGHNKSIGLSNVDNDAHYNTIDYAILFRPVQNSRSTYTEYQFFVYENGVEMLGDQFAIEGDEFTLSRQSSELRIFKGNKYVYSTDTRIFDELVVDVALFDNASNFKNVLVSFEIENPETSNNITINTKQFTNGIAYSIDINETVFEYESGGIAKVPMETIQLGKRGVTALMRFAGNSGANYMSNVSFSISSNLKISNVNSTLVLGGRVNEIPLNPELYEISGNEIKFKQGGIDEVQNSISEIYPVLQDGLLFSPDGDGLYDELQVAGVEYTITFRLSIFDKNNQLYFETFDKTASWNGIGGPDAVLAEPGHYSYEIDADGAIFSGPFLIEY